ncbi:MAG: hypothetical protein ABI969_06250 [bacterium]
MLRIRIPASRTVTLGFALLLVVNTPLAAQATATMLVSVPDSSQIMSMMANSMRLLKPAQFVLDHRTDLSLTPEQVGFLEFLVVAQRDSAAIRQARRMITLQASAAKGAMNSSVVAMAWTGTIDEQAMKDVACQQSSTQAESLLNLARDRHAVGAILTPAQIAQMPGIEAADIIKAAKRP